MLKREHYLAMDSTDPLGRFHEQFSLPENIIYLDGNSLGARPVAALERSRQVVAEEWGYGLIGSWNEAGWRALPERLGDKVAGLIGANPGEVVVTDTTSINLFKVLAAALKVQAGVDSKRKVIVTERSNFPTDIYIAQGLAELLDDGYSLRLVDSPEDLPAAIQTDTAVVMITQVNYKTGYLHDMKELTALAHECGALTIWDLCHSAGAVPIDLNGAKADYAIGCTYKYLNGGPGSPAFVWTSAALQDKVTQPLSGWWGHARQFQMETDYEPASGINRYQCGTQPITSLALIECGLDIFGQTTMEALREKSLALTDLFIELVQDRCAGFPLTLVTPLNHQHRGSHVSFEHPEGYAVVQALIEKGVVGDYREPRIMRFGFTPLYTRYVDVFDAVETLYSVLITESWRAEKHMTRKKVT
ncbi:kynureninase [Pseudomonas monteilii]|nr:MULTISPECIES: kynureninase [Pseudomonas putida group]MBH3346676.1 kynureninase [Pseudomonas putida]MCE1020676.1 kynureninase [Pseudomonas monteilii]MCE1038205.1 kynureninase [Pseudomonas monteilii]MCE1089770.1 kynureninase [Pseudomonas monteilii]